MWFVDVVLGLKEEETDDNQNPRSLVTWTSHGFSWRGGSGDEDILKEVLCFVFKVS